MDRKTQLENQILGSFPRLEPELLLASSVRGGLRGGQAAEREALVQALMDREFNRDDIDELKREQVLGEGRDGLLVELKAPADPERARLARDLLREENRDRMLVMRHVIASNPRLGERDLAVVQRAFHRLNAGAARPGDLVQEADGRWRVTPARQAQVRR